MRKCAQSPKTEIGLIIRVRFSNFAHYKITLTKDTTNGHSDHTTKIQSEKMPGKMPVDTPPHRLLHGPKGDVPHLDDC